VKHTASRLALEPTQPPIQWVPAVLSLGVSRHGVKLITDLYFMLRLRICGAIPPLPNTSSWHSAESSIGTTLPSVRETWSFRV